MLYFLRQLNFLPGTQRRLSPHDQQHSLPSLISSSVNYVIKGEEGYKSELVRHQVMAFPAGAF